LPLSLSVHYQNLAFRLSLESEIVKFFWTPNHVVITGNEHADHLDFSTKFSKQIPSFKLPAFDLFSIHRKLLHNAWQSKWSSLPPNFASSHKHTVLVILRLPWFKSLNIPRHLIVAFTHLRIGHSLLSHNSFKLSLNSSPLCNWHYKVTICNFNHLIFNCPSLLLNSQLLFLFLYFLGYITPNSNLRLRSIKKFSLLALLSVKFPHLKIVDITADQQCNNLQKLLSFFDHTTYYYDHQNLLLF
jgi:hypothetical protein